MTGASRGIGAATVRAGRRLLRVIAGAPDRATRNRLAAETGPGTDPYRALSPEEVAETVARALGIVAPILPGDP